MAPVAHEHRNITLKRMGALMSMALATSMVMVGVVSATPAAASTVVVWSNADLRAAVDSPCGSSGPRVVQLGWGFSTPYDLEVLRVRCDIQLDLAGRLLETGPISVSNGRTFHVMSSTGGGRLVAKADWSDFLRAGIGTDEAHLIIDGVTVEAEGGQYAAGIGGGGTIGAGHRYAEGGGTIEIINGANVTARSWAEGRGAGIGGGAALAAGRSQLDPQPRATGYGGDGGTIRIAGQGTVVTATSQLGAGIGGGNGAGWNATSGGGRGGIGGTIVIEDGARVTATSSRGAGIGGGTGTGYGTTVAGQGALVTVRDATVTAQSTRAAGIGGGDATETGSRGRELNIYGNSNVTARSLESGGGFGTGRLGANNDSQYQQLRVGEGSRLTVSSGSNSALRLDRGLAEIDGELRIASSTLTVTSHQFSISETGSIVAAPPNSSISPSINGNGTIVNDGAIVMNAVSGPTVQRNNFLVRFNREGGGSSDTRIYAPTFADAQVSLPQPSAGSEWNSADDGTGATLRYSTSIVPRFMSSDDHAGNTGSTVVHVYEAATTGSGLALEVAAPSGSVVAGEPFPIDARVVDAVGAVVDEHPDLTVIGTAHGVSIIPEGEGVAIVAGDVEATFATVHEGEELTDVALIEVRPAAAATMELDPASANALVGDTVAFTARAFDEYGNLIIVDDAVLSSNGAGDDVIDEQVIIGSEGERTITASSVEQGVDGQATVTAFSDITRYALRVVGAPGEVVAGEPFVLGTELVDQISGDTISDLIDVEWDFSDPQATIEDGEMIARTAGEIIATATAEHGGVTLIDSTTFEVLPAAPASLTVTPGAGVVVEDESVTFDVEGVDAFGNGIDASEAVLSSSELGDEVSGWTVTMREIGPRTITAVLGDASGTASYEVVVDSDRYELRVDAPASATAGVAFAAAAIVVDLDAGAPVPDQPAIAWGLGGAEAVRDDATGQITATGAGVLDIVVTAAYKGLSLGDDATIDVNPGPLATMTLSADRTSVYQDVPVVFTAMGADAFGNDVDVTAAVLSSTEDSDEIEDWTLVGTQVGERVVTVGLGGVEAWTTVTVSADSLRYRLQLSSLPTASIAGQPFALEAMVLDTATGALVSVVEPINWEFGDATVVEHGDGTATAFVAGPLTVEAQVLHHGLPLADAAVISVQPGALASLSFVEPAATVADGGTIDFTVAGTDPWGNPVDASIVVLSSSGSADVARGWSVTFRGAGERTVTAAAGDVRVGLRIVVEASDHESEGVAGERGRIDPTRASAVDTDEAHRASQYDGAERLGRDAAADGSGTALHVRLWWLLAAALIVLAAAGVGRVSARHERGR